MVGMIVSLMDHAPAPVYSSGQAEFTITETYTVEIMPILGADIDMAVMPVNTKADAWRRKARGVGPRLPYPPRARGTVLTRSTKKLRRFARHKQSWKLRRVRAGTRIGHHCYNSGASNTRFCRER